MMMESTKQVLKTYVEKSQKMRDFKFIEHVKSIGLSWDIKRHYGNELELNFGLPDDKDRDAFLLTFRLFIQQNEKISFYKIKNIFNDIALSNQFQEEVTESVDLYSTFINSYSQYTVNLFDGHPTRKEIMETVLYGGLAHTNNQATIDRYQFWSRDEIRANLLQQEFIFTIITVFRIIAHISELCEKELKKSDDL